MPPPFDTFEDLISDLNTHESLSSNTFIYASGSITGSFISGSFIGDGTEIEGVISSSYSISSSHADFAISSSHALKADQTKESLSFGAGLFGDAFDGSTEIITSIDSGSFAGTGLGADGTGLIVNVDDTTIEIDSDTLRVKDSGISNTKLTNSSIYISGSGISNEGSVALGATASIDIQVDDSTIEISGDNLRVKPGGITTTEIADSLGNINENQFTGSFTGSFVGDGSGLTGVEADSVAFDDITDKPTLISSSLQFNDLTSPFTGSFTGSFVGDGSGIEGVISSSYSITSSYSDFALSSSHALRADQADSVAFNDITGKPSLISSSLQFNNLTSPFTGSFTGSFVGDGSGLTGISGGSGTVTGTGASTQIAFWSNTSELNGSSNLTFDGSDLYVGGTLEIKSNNTSNNLKLTSTDTTTTSAPDLVLFADAAAQDGDTLGTLLFQGRNGMFPSSTTPLSYAAFFAHMADASNNHSILALTMHKGNGAGAQNTAMNFSLIGANNSAEGALHINPPSGYDFPTHNLEVNGTTKLAGNTSIGTSHTNNGTYSFIGGGICNTVESKYDSILGGDCNSIVNTLTGYTNVGRSSIVGGCNNVIDGTRGQNFIAGGYNNTISGSVCGFANYANVILGRSSLIDACDRNSITGGGSNIISGSISNSNIAGGVSNCITGTTSTVGGGAGNNVLNSQSVIAGGLTNVITNSYSTIGGGTQNTIESTRSGILGGTSNCITHSDSFAIGSNLTSTAACTTFMNNLDVEGTVSGSIFSGSFVGDGSGLTGISGGSGTVTGTGADAQIATWASSTGLEGSSNLLFGGNNLAMTIDNALTQYAGISIDQNGTGDATTTYAAGSAIFTVGIDNSNSDTFTIASGNSLGTSNRLEITTAGAATFSSTVTATNFILSSDESLKENIEDLDTVVDAKWKSYKFKDDDEIRYGVVAQELEKTNPELIRTNEQGLKSVAYIDLLIAKIAELEARLDKAGL